MRKVYVGYYPEPHVNIVEVRDLETGEVSNLDDYLNLSSEGEGPGTFTWGYGAKRQSNDSHAPGPLRLSYALLADALGKDAAERYAVLFLEQVISKIPEEGTWAFTAELLAFHVASLLEPKA